MRAHLISWPPNSLQKQVGGYMRSDNPRLPFKYDHWTLERNTSKQTGQRGQTGWTGQIGQTGKTWLTFKIELLLIWLKCGTRWLVVTLAMIDIHWKSWLIRFGTNLICVSFISTQLLQCSSNAPFKLIEALFFFAFWVSGSIICTQLLYWFSRSTKSFKTNLSCPACWPDCKLYKWFQL